MPKIKIKILNYKVSPDESQKKYITDNKLVIHINKKEYWTFYLDKEYVYGEYGKNNLVLTYTFDKDRQTWSVHDCDGENLWSESVERISDGNGILLFRKYKKNFLPAFYTESMVNCINEKKFLKEDVLFLICGAITNSLSYYATDTRLFVGLSLSAFMFYLVVILDRLITPRFKLEKAQKVHYILKIILSVFIYIIGFYILAILFL